MSVSCRVIPRTTAHTTNVYNIALGIMRIKRLIHQFVNFSHQVIRFFKIGEALRPGDPGDFIGNFCRYFTHVLK